MMRRLLRWLVVALGGCTMPALAAAQQPSGCQVTTTADSAFIRCAVPRRVDTVTVTDTVYAPIDTAPPPPSALRSIPQVTCSRGDCTLAEISGAATVWRWHAGLAVLDSSASFTISLSSLRERVWQLATENATGARDSLTFAWSTPDTGLKWYVRAPWTDTVYADLDSTVTPPPPPPAPPPPPPPPAPPPPPPPSGVWVQEDFSQYATDADLKAYPSSIWSGSNEDAAIGRIHLDTDAPPVGGKSMRYDFADRTNDPNLCHDYTIGRNITFPSTTQEVWVDQWVKFSPGFLTHVPACDGVSANGYKFIFVRCHGGGCGRAELKIGNQHSLRQTVGWPGMVTPVNWQVVPIGLQYDPIVDGQWHRWRHHWKIGNPAVVEVWFDSQKVYVNRTDPNNATSPFLASDLYGIALGRNMNQGPTQAQSMWWGRIRAYRADPGW